MKVDTGLFKSKVKNVVIIHRPGSKESLKTASDLGSYLQDRKIAIYSHPKRKFKVKSKYVPVIKNMNPIDLVIVLGGDGTYLEAVRLVNGKKIPILGINLGSLGFLTDTRLSDLYPTIDDTLNGKMEMRPRSLIKIKIKLNNKVVNETCALNDLVIERGDRSHLIFLKIFSQKLHVSDVKADGLIISTPTGSTAYNLAAGGPILHPEVKAFVITPICPHSLTNRPIIVPSNHKLSFKLYEGFQTANLTVDGKTLFSITPDHEIIVENDKKNLFVLKKPSHNYFKLLAEKLKFGERN